MLKTINIKKLIVRLLLFLLIILCLAGYVLNKKAKQYGYKNGLEVISIYFKNKKLAKSAHPLTMQINLSESDYEFLKEQRKIALDRGIQINVGDNYVDCDIKTEHNNSKGKLRLKGHMTDHLQGDKWSFRVKTKKEIMGMYRFSLQHPGTRNYIYEWVYHQLLKYENIIYLNYDFINLKLNDKDLGIYAIEEHFGQHVLKHNDRPKGMIVRWNPNLYWEWRINEFQNIYLDEAYSNYTSSFVEPYDKGNMLDDEELLNNYLTISKLLYEFRAGIKKTSEVFDVEKMAAFHAIIDLVGGHHSLDWSDVKLYYNSLTKKIEPVGYESFSIRKTERIAGQRIYASYDSLHFNYHDQLFNDPIFFKAYIKHLERIADESYMSDFIDEIKVEYNQKLGIIAKEWPYRKFDFEAYFENIRLIKNNLNLPKPFHAFIQSHNKDSIVLSIAPVSDFPIEILSLHKSKKSFPLINNFILKPKPRQSVLKFYELTVYGDFKKIKELKIKAKILGSQNEFEVLPAEYPAYKKEFKTELINYNLVIDTNELKVIGTNVYFKNKTQTIRHKINIPPNYTLHLKPGQMIELNHDVIVWGKMKSHGFKENYCQIKTNSKSQLKIYGTLEASQSVFTGEKLIKSSKANIKLYQCQIYDVTQNFIKDFKSDIEISDCYIANVACFANLNESTLNVNQTTFVKGKNVLKSNASIIKFLESSIYEYQNIGKLNYQSEVYTWKPVFKNNDTLFTLKNTSFFQSYGGEFIDDKIGYVILKNDNNIAQTSSYNMYNPMKQQLIQLEVREL
jgi:hypothetical protein